MRPQIVAGRQDGRKGKPDVTRAEADLSAFDRSVYRAIAAYAWDEAEAWPSQETIAGDVGCSRQAVNRAVRRLIAAKWLAIIDRRWSPRLRWTYNVYGLHEQFVVGALTIKRIVRRAHKRRNRWADWESGTARSGPGDTNPEGSTAVACQCSWCKADPGALIEPVARQRLLHERTIAVAEVAEKRLLWEAIAAAIRHELRVKPEMLRRVRLDETQEEYWTNCVIEGKHIGFAA